MQKNKNIQFNTLPHSGIQTLSPYVPGKSIRSLSQEKGISTIIKLASNENPRGCSPQVHQALANLALTQIASYPAPSTSPLIHKIAKKIGVTEDMVTLGNGSDAIFQLLVICFALHVQKNIITHDYAFQTFKILPQLFGVPLISTPVLNNWDVDIKAIIHSCTKQTALIFIANPNNPTGSLLSIHQIEELLENIPETTLLILDEAYAEYIETHEQKNSIELLKNHRNLIITRTFSKAYGLAGLRLGYAISDPEIKKLLQKIVLPFTVNQAAIAAGNAAIDDETFLQDTITLNRQEIHRLRDTLIKIGYPCLPSPANFITFDCKIDGKIIADALQNQGIIVRPLHAYGLDNFLRINSGTPEQNTGFINTLMSVLHSLRGS